MGIIAKQVQDGVPIYDLLDAGLEVGSMTSFPGEGPTATVRTCNGPQTVSAITLHECLVAANGIFRDAKEFEQQVDEYIEDEDGELARMRYEENKAQEWADQDPYYHY